MKAPLLPSILLCALCAAGVPASANPSDGDEPARLETFDFFNFAAMEKSPAGKVIRERIFEDVKSKSGSGELFRRLNEAFGSRVPDSVSRATFAAFVGPETGWFSLAKFDFSSADDARALAPLHTPDAADAWTPPSVPAVSSGAFSPLPADLAGTLPKSFLRGAAEAFFLADAERGSCVFAAAKRKPAPEEISPQAMRELSELIARTDSDALLLLIKFPRRVPPARSAGDFCPPIPAGNFSLEERGGNVNVDMVFDCLGPAETAFVEKFFCHIKADLVAAAQQTHDAALRRALDSVGGAMKISAEAGRLRIRIECSSEDFSEFLRWRSDWYPKQGLC